MLVFFNIHQATNTILYVAVWIIIFISLRKRRYILWEDWMWSIFIFWLIDTLYFTLGYYPLFNPELLIRAKICFGMTFLNLLLLTIYKQKQLPHLRFILMIQILINTIVLSLNMFSVAVLLQTLFIYTYSWILKDYRELKISIFHHIMLIATMLLGIGFDIIGNFPQLYTKDLVQPMRCFYYLTLIYRGVFWQRLSKSFTQHHWAAQHCYIGSISGFSILIVAGNLFSFQFSTRRGKNAFFTIGMLISAAIPIYFWDCYNQARNDFAHTFSLHGLNFTLICISLPGCEGICFIYWGYMQLLHYCFLLKQVITTTDGFWALEPTIYDGLFLMIFILFISGVACTPVYVCNIYVLAWLKVDITRLATSVIWNWTAQGILGLFFIVNGYWDRTGIFIKSSWVAIPVILFILISIWNPTSFYLFFGLIDIFGKLPI